MKKTKVAQKSRIRKKGLPPGSLIYTGKKSQQNVGVKLHTFSEKEWDTDSDFPGILKKLKDGISGSAWLEVSGLAETGPIVSLFESLGLGALFSEDILNTVQDAKTEIQPKMIFQIVKNIAWNPVDYTWDSEQISLVLKPELVVSFTEISPEWLDPIFTRMKNPDSKVRTHGHDFTFYALTDLIVDGYLEICGDIDAALDEIEMKMDLNSSYDPTASIHQIKKFLIYFRHQVLPIREGISRLLKDTGGLISADDYPYYQDILDHTNQIISQIDQIRENLTGIRELYLTQISLRMNKVIQLLTLVSSIFLPLTLITGIFGMNFESMPGTGWKYGFTAILGLMVLIGTGFYLYYRRQKWL